MTTQAKAEASPSSTPDPAPAAALAPRECRAMDAIRSNMAWSVGAGILPFPLFDLLAITGVQLKLIKEISDIYGVPFSESAAKAVVTSLVGALSGGTVATIVALGSLKFIPFAGTFFAVTSLAASYAGITYTVGRVFIKHFETGGNLLDLDPNSIREYFRKEFEKGLKEAETEQAEKKKK